MRNQQTEFAQRFADRLRRLLLSKGAPSRRVPMCRELGALVDIPISEADHLLSGSDMPEWPMILKLCSHFSVEPGYFLDRKVSHDLQVRPLLVRGATGGEPIMWSPPRGFEDEESNCALSSDYALYWASGTRLPNDNLRPTDVVIFGFSPTTIIKPGCPYIIEQDGAFKSAVCEQIGHGSAMLKVYSHSSAIDMILPINANNVISIEELSKTGLSNVGPIFGAMRSQKHFKLK